MGEESELALNQKVYQLEAANAALAEAGECWRLLRELIQHEGDSIKVMCHNPDGRPDYAIDCCGKWTRYDVLRFEGNTRRMCLEKAAVERRMCLEVERRMCLEIDRMAEKRAAEKLAELRRVVAALVKTCSNVQAYMDLTTRDAQAAYEAWQAAIAWADGVVSAAAQAGASRRKQA